MSIKLICGKTGKAIRLRCEWNDEIAVYMTHKGIRELHTSIGLDSRPSNIDFIGRLTFLRGILIDCFKEVNLDQIYTLSELNYLGLYYPRNPKINLSHFKRLSILDIELRGTNPQGLFQCSNLNELRVSNLMMSSSVQFSSLKNLRKLSIMYSNIAEVQGLTRLESLAKLHMFSLSKLESIHGLEDLENLAVLEIEKCKNLKKAWPTIMQMKGLRMLVVYDSGLLPSAKDVLTLKNLEWLSCEGFEDADVEPLLLHPKLWFHKFRVPNVGEEFFSKLRKGVPIEEWYLEAIDRMVKSDIPYISDYVDRYESLKGDFLERIRARNVSSGLA